MEPGIGMNERLRVAMVAYTFGEYCVRLTSALAQEADVCLVLPEEFVAPYRDILDPKVELLAFDRPRLRHPLRQLATARRIVKHITRFEPDVIHMQQGHMWFNLALPWLRQYPFVMTAHDPRHHVGDKASHKTPQWLVDYGFRRADRLIVHGEQLKQVLVDELGIGAERVSVMPMVAHGDAEAGGAVEEEEGTVLFFGRIWGYKGLDYLIRSEPLISERVPNLRIIIAGEGESMDRYRKLMVHPERFEVYHEYVSDEKRAQLFRRASVVVLPYVEATQSGVIPVAYTYGKPVVATTVGGLPELVDEGRTGFLVAPRDEAALAEVTVRLLQDANLRHTMGANARHKVETECSPAAVARQTFTVYYSAIGVHGGKTAPRPRVEEGH